MSRRLHRNRSRDLTRHLGWIALRGDWDGDGTDTAGLYDPVNGHFFLKNTNAGGEADLVYGFGPAKPGWKPLVGDWNGDGIDTIGLYDPVNGDYFLRNKQTAARLKVPFLVVDFAQTRNGEWIVIECNDTQESGYAGVAPQLLWRQVLEQIDR